MNICPSNYMYRMKVTKEHFFSFVVLQTFQNILSQLQQQNITRMHNARPGLLGMAPHMPHNNLLLNPNIQVALLAVILASQIQQVSLSLIL